MNILKKILDFYIDPETYIKKVTVGKYVYGFDQVAVSTLNPFRCCITEKEFVFKAQSGMGKKIGRIPRDKITQINVENKMQATKRVTVPRLLMFGIFAFAAQKKEKVGGFEIVINWDDNGKRDAVFEFTGPLANAEANKALTTLRSFIKK
jgi:hypothetical protein